MRIDVITIFGDMVSSVTDVGVIGRARRGGLLDIRVHDPRDATTDVHRTVDDAPFGGGAGMVMRPEPLFDTVERVKPPRPVLLMGPSGDRFDQATAQRMAGWDGFTLVCGRYEGVDARVVKHLCDAELSVGDFVLAGGEVAALSVIEAVGRLVPGVLGNAASPADESFTDGLLEYPQFTRPATYRGLEVPAVLRSGDHARIARWRRAQALARTIRLRPDLIAARGGLSPADEALVEEFGDEPGGGDGA